MSVDGFQETNSGVLNLGLHRQELDSLRNHLGVRATYVIPLKGGKSIVPILSAEWQHEFADTDYALNAGLRGGQSSNFTVHSAKIGRDSILVRAGFSVNLCERVSTYLTYQGDLAATNYQSQAVLGGVAVQF